MHRSSIGSIRRNAAFDYYNHCRVLPGNDVNESPITTTTSTNTDEPGERIVRNNTGNNESLSLIELQHSLQRHVVDPSKDRTCSHLGSSHTSRQPQVLNDDITETEDVSETTTSLARYNSTWDIVTESAPTSNRPSYNANTSADTILENIDVRYEQRTKSLVHANSTSTGMPRIDDIEEQFQNDIRFDSNDIDTDDVHISANEDGFNSDVQSIRRCNKIHRRLIGAISSRSEQCVDDDVDLIHDTFKATPLSTSTSMIDHHLSQISLPELINRIERACSNTAQSPASAPIPSLCTPRMSLSLTPIYDGNKVSSLDQTLHNDRGNNIHFNYDNDDRNNNFHDMDRNSSYSWTEEECGTATSSDWMMFRQQHSSNVIESNNFGIQEYNDRANMQVNQLQQLQQQHREEQFIDSSHNERGVYNNDDDSSHSGCSLNLRNCASCDSSVTWYEGSDIDEIPVSSSMDNDDDDSMSKNSNEHQEQLDDEMLSTFS